MSRFVVVVMSLVDTIAGHPVLISNVEPRLDSTGHILSAHDGDVVQWTAGGDFHFYGMSYGNCKAQGCSKHGDCGFQNTHNITLFTSSDLSQGSWKYQGHVLPFDARPAGIYYRPKVIFNKLTGRFVLWVNWLANRRDFGSSSYLVATSATASGPFTVVSENVPMKFNVGGDFDIFVDDDETAYFIYTSLAEGHGISIERLAADYLSSTQQSTGILTGRGCFEAPAMFKRRGVYYALYGSCCCFCTSGDTRYAMIASSPLNFSTATAVYSLGRAGGAQENYVMPVATTTGMEYIWMGDRWNSAPDGIKDHDFQYWAPVEFNDQIATGRFIKAADEAAIFWEDAGVKYHVLHCGMCHSEGDLCANVKVVGDDYIDELMNGTSFSCDQNSGGPILPVRQIDNFTINLQDVEASLQYVL
jgi:hypothetical protein